MSSVKIVFNKLPQMQGAVRGKVADEVKNAALAVEGQAKAIAPVDTGALRNSIQAEAKSDLTWRVGVGVEYGQFVEYGTYKSAAQPYMTPAAEQVEPQFVANVKKALNGL